MKFKAGIEVDGWFQIETEAEDAHQVAAQIVDQVDDINKRLEAAGVTWLSVEARDYATIVVTSEAGKRSVFETPDRDDDYEEDDEGEEDEDEDEEVE